MSARFRLLLSLPVASLTLLSLASGGCQTILDIGDPRLDPGDAGAPGEPDTGGGEGGSGGTGAPDSAVTPGFTFAVLSPNITVPLGGKNVIQLEIQRTGGFSGEVTVTPKSPPVGLLVEPLTVGAAETSAELVVGAGAPLALGNTVSFTVTATSGDLEPRTAAVTDAVVTGRPGGPDEAFGISQSGLAPVGFGADDGGGFLDLEVVGEQIVAAGFGVGGLGGSSFSVTRLTSSGGIDPAFAGGTLVKTRFGSSSGSTAIPVAVGHQVDGRIVALGWHRDANPGNIAAERYGANGSTSDPYFGVSGKSLIDLGGQEEVSDGLILPNDTLLFAGQRDGNMMVARATQSGELDHGFNAPNGYQQWSLAQPSSAGAVLVDNQNRIVVAGRIGAGGDHDVLVGRLLQNGLPDAAFGTGGIATLGASGTDERAVAAAVLADGRILVAGDSNANGNVDFQVRRLLEGGAPDPSFGTNGVATLPITDGDDAAEDMVVLPDGRILVVGNTVTGATRGPVLARYTRDGKLDPYFGIGGVSPLYVGENGQIHCVTIHPGHKVILGGGNEGGTPGPGTFGIVARLWM